MAGHLAADQQREQDEDRQSRHAGGRRDLVKWVNGLLPHEYSSLSGAELRQRLRRREAGNAGNLHQARIDRAAADNVEMVELRAAEAQAGDRARPAGQDAFDAPVPVADLDAHAGGDVQIALRVLGHVRRAAAVPLVVGAFGGVQPVKALLVLKRRPSGCTT